MTLLTITQDAADEIGITQPGSVVGNAAPEAQKLLRYANKVGNRLMKLVAWQVLRKEQTFTALGQETQTSILPSDFDRFVAETFWDRTNRYLVSGPVSAVEWQGLKATAYQDPRRKFIYRGSDVLVIPAFSGGESLAFEYVSNQWAQSSVGAAKSSFTVDTDVPKLDSELITYGVIYEYLNGEGLPTQAAAVAYEDRFNLMIGNDQPSAGILVAGDIFGGGRHFTGTPTVDGASSLL